MNPAQIEENIQQLVQNLNKETFIYDLLLAYNTPKASVARLQTGNLNMSKVAGEISWKKKLLYRQVSDDDLHDSITNLVQSSKHDQRFVIVTDFETLMAIDTKTKEKLDIPLTDLPKHFDFFLPWAGMEKAQHMDENPADVKAADKMAKLFDEIKKDNPDTSPEFTHGLNVFLSRLLFCYFAEDTHIFEDNQFTNALESHTLLYANNMPEWFDRFFLVLDTPEDKRRSVSGAELPEYLNAFPYVNGGLFSQRFATPKFTRRSRQLIIDTGTIGWKEINPDIFGSMFQAVISVEQRGNLGQHYTSVPNIMKVIEPLFLTDLYEEFEKSKGDKKRITALLVRLSKIKIFDPACGSGNFLIIAYKELRKLEMLILKELNAMAISTISLNNFYGIEIDDFAHEIAKLALWLAEHQMNVEFYKQFGRTNPTLPLKEAGNIIQANACRIDWEMVCPKNEGDEIYILGNPPFNGARNQTREQKEDVKIVFDHNSIYKDADYISCWFLKASSYIEEINGKYAFVSTNSICQGDHVAILWPLVFKRKMEIFFAYEEFKWSNNAKKEAGVTCIIVGLRNTDQSPKFLYKKGIRFNVANINGYLANAKNIIVEKRNEPITPRPKVVMGNQARDGGNLILEELEKNKIEDQYPESKILFRKLIGSDEFIKGKVRWCLWILDENRKLAESIPPIKVRIDAVYKFRISSKAKTTNGYSTIPHKFAQRAHKEKGVIIIPAVSSERREYIPFGFIEKDTIISNRAFIINEQDSIIFGFLSSKIHMIWVKAVAGRLETRINYSSGICYNTFPLPQITEQHKQEITQWVFRILDEREKYSNKSLAQLYDPDKMPEDLREAHRQNDLAIERCYRSKPFESDEERLEYLFKLYEKMIADEEAKKRSSMQSEILYHYTTMGTLLKIMKRVEETDELVFRATQIEYLNDVSEFKIGIEVVQEVFQKYENDGLDTDNKMLTKSLTESNWNILKRAFFSSPYITSFSKEKDSLPMWSTYAEQGYGVAIGVEKIDAEKIESINGKPRWGLCTYNREKLKKVFERNVKDLYDRIEVKNDRLRHRLIDTPFSDFLCILKHPAYSYEREVRLINQILKHPSKIEFSEVNGLLKPYVENIFPISALKEIVVGPCADKSLSMQSVNMCLSKAGYNTNEMNKVKVKASIVPFRNI